MKDNPMDDNPIDEYILKPIQTDRRVWAAGGIALALILIVALWPSKTEVVKAVVKHEVAIHVDAAKEKTGKKIDEVVERITEIDKSTIQHALMDKELVFLDSIMSESDREMLDKHYSKTKEATAAQHAHLYEMVTPYSSRQLNEVELFFQRGIAYTMNDPVTPGIITEWEARWITIVYNTGKGHIIKQRAIQTKQQLQERFRKDN